MKKSLSITITIIIITLIRLLVLSRLDLFPDEAYYWDWSRFLSGGYFDHPPMVAWLVFLSTSVLGDAYWGVKAVPLILGLGVTILACLFAKPYLKSSRSFVLLVIMASGTILYAAGGLILTPDIPFLFFWALGLFIGQKALFEDKVIAWPLLGVVCGLGLLSKYVYILFIGAFALFLLMDKDYRKLWLSWKPWTALILAIITFLPNVFWNARHEWVSYLFQFGHGFNNDKTWPQIGLFFEYLGGQIGLFSPFLSVVLVMAIVHYVRKSAKESKIFYLLIFLFVPLLFFAWSSFSARVEANWPAPAFLTGFVLVIWYYERVENRVGTRRFILFSITFTVILTALLFAHAARPFLPIPARQDRTLDPAGWSEFAFDIAALRRQVDPEKKLPLCANTYQIASLLAFHSPDQPRTWALNLDSRTNHYALLEERANVAFDTLFYVSNTRNGNMPNHMQKYFTSPELVSTVVRRFAPAEVDSFALFKVTLSDIGREELLNEADDMLHP